MVKYCTGVTKCDACNSSVDKIFYDAKTVNGPWGNLCPSCFHFGPGLGKLGIGLGQEWTKRHDGLFEKTGG